MPINLPQDGYTAMVLINQLANSNKVAGVAYDVVKEKGGVCVLSKITVHIGARIIVNPPGPMARAKSGMMKLNHNRGLIINSQ